MASAQADTENVSNPSFVFESSAYASKTKHG